VRLTVDALRTSVAAIADNVAAAYVRFDPPFDDRENLNCVRNIFNGGVHRPNRLLDDARDLSAMNFWVFLRSFGRQKLCASKGLDGSAKVKIHIIVRLYEDADHQMIGRLKQREVDQPIARRVGDDRFQHFYSRRSMFGGQCHF